MFERDEANEHDNFFDPPGGGWEDFDAEGDLVTVTGPQKDDTAAYLAYSTLMAEWLRTPKSRLLSFVRHSACSPQQALAMDRHLHWFEWEFNCFARNRRGIIKATKQIIADIIAEAETLDEEEDKDGTYKAEGRISPGVCGPPQRREEPAAEYRTALHIRHVPGCCRSHAAEVAGGGQYDAGVR